MATSSSKQQSDETRTDDTSASRSADTETAAVSGAATPERTAARSTVAVGEPEAQIDRVAMVSRRKDGEADQGAGYEVLHRERAGDTEREAAENVAGKRAGQDRG